jgi:hypothetical protein
MRDPGHNVKNAKMQWRALVVLPLLHNFNLRDPGHNVKNAKMQWRHILAS